MVSVKSYRVLDFGLCPMKMKQVVFGRWSWKKLVRKIANTEPSSEPSTEPSDESILPFAEAGLDQSVILGDTVILDGTASIGKQFVWTQSYGRLSEFG